MCGKEKGWRDVCCVKVILIFPGILSPDFHYFTSLLTTSHALGKQHFLHILIMVQKGQTTHPYTGVDNGDWSQDLTFSHNIVFACWTYLKKPTYHNRRQQQEPGTLLVLFNLLQASMSTAATHG